MLGFNKKHAGVRWRDHGTPEIAVLSIAKTSPTQYVLVQAHHGGLDGLIKAEFELGFVVAVDGSFNEIPLHVLVIAHSEHALIHLGKTYRF